MYLECSLISFGCSEGYHGGRGQGSVSFYFKQYNTYHNTHEAIFNMYQRYIMSGFRPKKLIYPDISWEFGYFNDQNILNLSKNVSFEVSCK